MSKYPVIPYYKVTRLIQEGGTSAVYEGIDLRSKSVVAIKALFSNKAKDAFMLKRFKEEANHYLLLNHPNIPKLVDFVIDDGQLYLIMEYVKGMDLGKYLQANGPLNEDLTIHFFSMILDTIAYLHKQNILHLDIKPSNIMVTEGLGIKVLDLGISAMVSEGEKLKKKCGSPSFMAPEQTRGEKLGFYTDIYQIGVTLFNMITGKLPFVGSTQRGVFDNICNNAIPRLSDYAISVNVAIQSVIDKSMSKDGGERYRSCEEFKDALLDSLSITIEEGTDKSSNIVSEVETKETISNMKIISVGREIGNDIVITDDSFVGRHHLQLYKDDAGVFFVRDLNSTNGTFVNGQRIKGEIQIEEHDIIRIGNTTLPWISYFVESGETELEIDEPKKKRRRRKKKTPEEIKARKEKIKKSLGSAGKWFLRTLLAIGTSILMMLLYRMIISH